MEENIFNLNNKIYSNNNNILFGIINDLQQIINYSKDNKIIKILGDIIIKMNNIIDENKKNIELLRKDISILYDKFSKKLDDLKINNNQEIKYNKSRRNKYIGQVLNGVPEGKGIMYWNNGDRLEGEWKNDKAEGKGIYYFANGDRYEGDYRNGKREGKGIEYYNNGDRIMGDYLNDKPIGKHVMLTKYGDINNYNY